VLETATSVGGFSNVFVDTDVESADTIGPLTDCIVIEYTAAWSRPATVTGLDVTSASTATPFAYTV
jgi:hypothetical protein